MIGVLKQNLQQCFAIDGECITFENALTHWHWRMSKNTSDDKSTLFQVMPWCRQTTSQCSSQCWSDLCRYISIVVPTGLMRPMANDIYTKATLKEMVSRTIKSTEWRHQISAKVCPESGVQIDAGISEQLQSPMALRGRSACNSGNMKFLPTTIHTDGTF